MPGPPVRMEKPLEVGWLERHPGMGYLALAAVGGSTVVGAATAYKPIDGVAIVVALVVGLAVLRRPAFGGYLLVALVPVLSGLRRGFPIPQIRIAEALIAGIGLIVLFTADRRQAMRWTKIDWLLVAWAGGWMVMGGLNVILLHQSLGTRTIQVLIGPFQFLLLYRAVLTALPLAAQRRRALALFMWASVPVSLLAVAQQLRIASLQRFIANITGGDVFNTYAYHYFARATGPFNHWTPLAGYLFVVLLTGFGLVLGGDSPVPPRRLATILLLAATGLVLSAELSAIIGTLIGATILGAWYRRLGQIGRAMGIGIVLIAITFGSYFNSRLTSQFAKTTGSARKSFVPQSIDYRFQIWDHQYYPAIGQRPVTGWGPNLPTFVTWPFTESQYVTLLMQGGLPLLCAYGALMWALYDRGRKLGRRGKRIDPLSRSLARSLAVTVVVLAPMNAIFPYFTAGGLPEPFWILAAFVASSTRTGPEQAPAPVAARALSVATR